MKKSMGIYENRKRGEEGFFLSMYKLTSSIYTHWHSEFEIIHVQSGELVLDLDGTFLSILPGETVFVNPGHMHGLREDKPFCAYAIVFPLSLLSMSNYDICQKQLLHPLIDGKIVFPLKYDNQKLINELICEIDSGSHTARLKVKILLYSVITDLYDRGLFKKEDCNSNHKIKQIKDIVLFLEDNFKSRISIEDISKKVKMSKFYLCRFFKLYTGSTLVEYINYLRINRAITLISQQNLPVTEVALECGFDNISHFIRTFKKITGTTPGKYRKN